MRKSLIFVVVMSMLLLPSWLFAGGQQEVDEDVVELTLAVQAGEIEDDYLEEALDEFHSQYPHIRVTEIVPISAADWPDYFTQVRTLIAGGDPPDVVRVAIEGIQYMVDANMALPLNDFFDDYPEILDDYDDLHPNLQSAFEIDDDIYGLTWDWNNIVTHINTDMLEDVGLPFPEEDWSKEEFLEYAQELTREVDGEQVFGITVPEMYFQTNAWLYNFDAAFLTDDLSESALDTPEALDAFQFMYDLVHEYEVSPRPDPDPAYMDRFSAEQVAMVWAGRWPNALWAENDVNFDIQYVPTFRTNEVIFGSGAFPVLTMSQNPEEAFLLSSFLSSREAQDITIQDDRIYSRISLMDEIIPDAPPENSQLYGEAADIARPVQSPPEYPELGDIFHRYYSAMMAQEMSVEDAVEAMHNEFNEALGVE